MSGRTQGNGYRRGIAGTRARIFPNDIVATGIPRYSGLSIDANQLWRTEMNARYLYAVLLSLPLWLTACGGTEPEAPAAATPEPSAEPAPADPIIQAARQVQDVFRQW